MLQKPNDMTEYEWEVFLINLRRRRRRGGVRGGGLAGAGSPPLAYNSRIAQIGDSIINAQTGYTSSSWINSFTDIVDWANLLSGSRAFKPQGANKGVGGETSTQIAARFTTDMVPFSPQVIVANGGINDSDAVTATQVLANIDSMISQANALGAKLAYIPPYQWSGESSAQATRRPLVVAGAIARQNANFKVVDISAFDYNTMCYTEILGGGAGSKIHPNIIGAKYIAASLSSILNGWVSAGSPLLAASDPNNKIANGYMTGTGGSLTSATGQVADSWTLDNSAGGGATVVGAKVARSAGGFWQQVTISGSYTGNGRQVALSGGNDIAGISAGDLIEVTADIEVDSGSVFVNTVAGFLIAFSSDYAVNSQVGFFRGNIANGNGFSNVPQFRGVFRVMPMSMSGAAPVHFNVQFIAELREGGSASPVAAVFRVGSVGIRKLNAAVPGMMLAPTLAPGNAQISVTRAADPPANGAVISGYDIRYSTDQATWTTVSMTTNPQALTGLSTGVLYYVQTRAKNAVGDGNWSLSATATPAAQSNIIANGDFSNGSTGWSGFFGTVSVSGGKAVFANTAQYNQINQTVAPVSGKYYDVTYTISGYSAGSIQFYLSGGTQRMGTTRSANGTYTERLLINSGNNTANLITLGGNGSGGNTFSLDDVSMVGPYDTP